MYSVVRNKHIVESGDILESSDLKNMIKLGVDVAQNGYLHSNSFFIEEALAEMVDSEGNITTSYPAFTITAYLPIELEPGKHTATVQVQKTSGEILEYSWSFTIAP